MEVVKGRFGQNFRPRMRPPAALEFLKFNSAMAGRFEVPADDPETASVDWADDEEVAVRQELRSRQPPAAVAAAQPAAMPPASAATASLPQQLQPSHPAQSQPGPPAQSQPGHPAQSQPSHPAQAQPSHPDGPPSKVPKLDTASATKNGIVIPGIPAKPLPDPPLQGGGDIVPHGGAGLRHSAPPSVQNATPQATQQQQAGSTRHLRPEHGLPPPQSLPPPTPLVPPSGNFGVAPSWRPLQGKPAHQLPPTPPRTLPMAPTPPVYHTAPPPAAPYADVAVYSDSGEYMPPLPSEPYDGDGSPPPPLPDEPPPLPDEPYEVAFADSQV